MSTESQSSGDWQIQLSEHFRPFPQVRQVVFDFDGTLSLIRGGWAEIMVEQFLEHLPGHGTSTPPEMRQSVLHDILALNGKPTIYQMELLADMVVQQGGEPDSPDKYNLDFQRRLRARISERLHDIRTTPARRDHYLVHEARTILTLLRDRGMVIHLLSGTAKADLLIESEALGIAEFLGERIYGPENLKPGFSKRDVFEQIVRQHSLSPGELMCFGDGAVEIMDTRHFEGLAMAVASDESANGSGRLDENKKSHLLKAGAHAVIPDYRHAEQLLQMLLTA